MQNGPYLHLFLISYGRLDNKKPLTIFLLFTRHGGNKLLNVSDLTFAHGIGRRLHAGVFKVFPG
jgi:hypothetical protein